MSSEENTGMETEDETPILVSGTPGPGLKRKHHDEEPSQEHVTPSTAERQSFDFFANLKAARKKLKFGNELQINDVISGINLDGVLKFRVTWTSGLRDSQSGKTKYFKFICADDSGKMSCTLFGDSALTFSAKIKPGNAYKLTGFQAKEDAYDFNMTNRNIALYFLESSKLDELDEETVPKIQFNFKSFDELLQLPKGSTGDFLGIMVQDWGLRNVNNKTLRDISFANGEKQTVTLTFFGDFGRNFRFIEGMPAALGTVTVSEYKNRKSIKVSGNPYTINPATFACATEMKQKFDAAVAAIDMEIDD